MPKFGFDHIYSFKENRMRMLRQKTPAIFPSSRYRHSVMANPEGYSSALISRREKPASKA